MAISRTGFGRQDLVTFALPILGEAHSLLVDLHTCTITLCIYGEEKITQHFTPVELRLLIVLLHLHKNHQVMTYGTALVHFRSGTLDIGDVTEQMAIDADADLGIPWLDWRFRSKICCVHKCLQGVLERFSSFGLRILMNKEKGYVLGRKKF